MSHHRSDWHEDILNDRLIDVKFGDVMAHIFLSAVSEHFKLGLVHPHDDAVRPDPVQADAGVIEKIREILFTSTQGILDAFLLRDIPRDF